MSDNWDVDREARAVEKKETLRPMPDWMLEAFAYANGPEWDEWEDDQ